MGGSNDVTLRTFANCTTSFSGEIMAMMSTLPASLPNSSLNNASKHFRRCGCTAQRRSEHEQMVLGTGKTIARRNYSCTTAYLHGLRVPSLG